MTTRNTRTQTNMNRFILTLLFATTALLPTPALAGCPCGNSYISETYTCHKCPCGCPRCDYRDCRMPEMIQPVLRGTGIETTYCQSRKGV